jgi:hypothetical protein
VNGGVEDGSVAVGVPGREKGLVVGWGMFGAYVGRDWNWVGAFGRGGNLGWLGFAGQQ